MEVTLAQIAAMLNGSVEGDANAKVNHFTKIEEGKSGSLSFLANPAYTQYIYETEATAVIVSNQFVPEKEIKTNLIKVADPYSSFAKLLEFYQQIRNSKRGVSSLAFVSPTAKVSPDAYVGEFVFVGDNVEVAGNVILHPQVYLGDNVKIGEGSVLNPGVKVYHDCVIGKNCIIHAGTVVGSDGFGFAPQADGTYKKIPQIGNVMIEDNVEVGANSTIDRATMGSTILKSGVKLDNLVQIAHNVVVGENTVMAALSGIAGSTKVGRNCVFAGMTAVAGHKQVADRTTVGANSFVSGNVANENQTLVGFYAFDANEFKKDWVHFRNLNKLVARIDELERKLKEQE